MVILLTSKVIFKMMTADKDKFREKTLGHLNQYLCDIRDSDGNWTVKGFIDKNKIYTAFNTLFKKFQDAAIVVSYRSDGIPSIRDLKSILRKYKPVVREERYSGYKYVLSNNNSEECLLLGLDGNG